MFASITAARRAACLAAWLVFLLAPSAGADAQPVALPSDAAATPAGLQRDGFNRRVLAARDAAGVDPRQGLAALQRLRSEAARLPTSDARLVARLSVDEAECRVLADFNKARSPAVVAAGLAMAGSAPPAVARAAWLRLRVCGAGALADLSGLDQGLREMQAVMSAITASDALDVRALALMERGVHRSRAGDLQAAQRDLLPACEMLKAHGPAQDHELCTSYLANHYRRVGDLDESLRLQVLLRDQAQARGATYDQSIHTYAVAQVQQALLQWSAAMDSYQAAAAASEKLDDRTGVSYAAFGVATALMRLNRPAEALAQADRAMALLDRADEPRQHANTAVTRAEALTALQRIAPARQALEDVAPTVRQLGDRPLLALWLLAQSQVMRAQGRWAEAYQALAEARGIEDDLHRQKLSEQAARMRMQFNRQRDADDLSALREINDQGQRLRQTQGVALVLFMLLLAVLGTVAVRKVRQARRLHDLASTDELTGLANRRALTATAENALARSRRDRTPLAMLMVDVDHFKQINDTHGHAIGDEMLRHLARVLAASLREQDTLGRLGGEEFLAVLPSASLADARRVAERMCAAAAASPLPGPHGPVAVTVSIGVAGGDEVSAAALIARADAALYQAKHAGRNTVAVEDRLLVPQTQPQPQPLA
ncbi:MAG: hypothetical protein RJA10_662 [Pseudomonadota bacterium]|jgi:diguanylate cyclase (GGDEF)-like protein